jgi:hypothetical protein
MQTLSDKQYQLEILIFARTRKKQRSPLKILNSKTTSITNTDLDISNTAQKRTLKSRKTVPLIMANSPSQFLALLGMLKVRTVIQGRP